MRIGGIMDRAGGWYGSMPSPLEVHGRIWENRPGQRGPLEWSRVSQPDAGTFQVLAIPSLAISLGIQLLASDCQSYRQEHLWNAVKKCKFFFINISIIYLISQLIPTDPWHHDWVGKQLGPCHQLSQA